MFKDESVSHNDEVISEGILDYSSHKESESLYARSSTDLERSESENE